MPAAGLLLLINAATVLGLRSLRPYGTYLIVPVHFVVLFGFWLFTARLLSDRDVGWRPLLPGTLVTSAGLVVLQAVAQLVVPGWLRSAEIYGPHGVSFTLLLWLMSVSYVVVAGAVLNAVLWEDRRSPDAPRDADPEVRTARPPLRATGSSTLQ